MNKKQPTLRRLRALLVAGALSLAPLLGHAADVIYVSYNAYLGNGYWGPNNLIEKFDAHTGADLGVFATGGLSGLAGMALDRAGNLYVANAGNNTILKFTPDGAGSVFAHTVSIPQTMAFDGTGNLFVASYWGNTIEKFTPDGVASLFVNTGQYSSPLEGLACDSKGNLYLGCMGTGNYGIRKYTPDGVGSLFATAWDINANAMVFDGQDNLYVANRYRNTIDKFTPDGVRSISASLVPGGPWIGDNVFWGVAVQVPEPSTVAFFGISLPALLALVRRFVRRSASKRLGNDANH